MYNKNYLHVEAAAEQSIEEFYQQWFRTMENRNIDGFLSLLADDFYFKSPAQPATSDTSVLRKGLEQYHQMYESVVDWEIEDIQLFDNHAVVRIAEEIKLINRQSNDISQIGGVHLAVLIKNEAGQWKLQTDVSSLNRPVSKFQ